MYWRRKHSPERAFGRVRGPIGAALVFVIAVSLAACTDRPATEDEFAADTLGGMTGDTTGMMAESPGMMHGMQDDMREDTVEVELVAFEIDMPETLPAGETIFRIENAGEIEHGFEIEGQGEEWVVESIPVGESETLTANLRPGTYTVYCPVGNHREEGMEMTLTVEESETTARAY